LTTAMGGMQQNAPKCGAFSAEYRRSGPWVSVSQARKIGLRKEQNVALNLE
jgi:hypothetical protein